MCGRLGRTSSGGCSRCCRRRKRSRWGSGGARLCGGGRGLPQDERGPRAGGQDREGPRHPGRRSSPGIASSAKRPTFNDEYLATFNRPNVHLVDVSERKGRGPHHREGRRRERRRVRGGLHHLRHRLRDHLVTAAAHQLRRRSAGAASRCSSTGRRALQDPARPVEPRLPELVLHRREPERAVGEHDGPCSTTQARHVAYIIDEVLGRGRTVGGSDGGGGSGEWVAEISPARVR